MARYKSLFKDINYKGTISNIQSCLRMKDVQEINDGHHLLSFDMMGLFSFREMTVQNAVDYWMEFLKSIGIKPDYVTIHPDKPEWKELYSNYDVEIKFDEECIWSDGDIGGYCTEFYKDGIEIGNIVNPLGTCIDVGFGKNRLDIILTGVKKTREETLRETVFKIISSGYTPTYNKQGSILRKLLRICYLENIVIDHEFYRDEIIRQGKIIDKYNRMSEKPKFKDKDRSFWFNTLGLDIDLISGVI